MSEEFGVLCKQADGELVIVTTHATSPVAARRQVEEHQSLFYGPGDGAGQWLASRNPQTIVAVQEARTLAEWKQLEEADGQLEAS